MANGTTTPTPCSAFPTGTSACQTIQLIEPDFTLPTVTLPPPGNDPSLVESGNVILAANAGVISVTFLTPKAGDYRFEYLYVDALGLANPGIIDIIPVTQTMTGFTVDLAGVPTVAGYILRWRVTVVIISTGPVQIDAPESFRVQLPQSIAGPPAPLPVSYYTLQVLFVNPRSTTTYGFSELRVENLVDLPANQSVIGVQVYEKDTLGFKILFNPLAHTANYYLVGRTP
jgi:hypothetical protein